MFYCQLCGWINNYRGFYSINHSFNDINSGKTEECDLIDNNCDNRIDTDANGKTVCSCTQLKEAGKSSAAVITTRYSQPFLSGTPISFAARDTDALSYMWDFGDAKTKAGIQASNTYSNPGAYTVKLTVLDSNECQNIDSFSLTIKSCLADTDCGTGKECKLGICENKQVIIPNATINTTLPQVQASINIISPKNNQVFTDSKILLIYSTTPANTQCSYSLNNDPSYITLQSNQADITGKEGSISN